LYCSVLSLGGNVNTRRMSKPEMGSIFHINNQWNILVIGNYYVNYQNYQNAMFLTSSDTRGTLRHLFLFTNSAQNWFQCVRRVYTTAIIYPCITFLALMTLCKISFTWATRKRKFFISKFSTFISIQWILKMT